jgi:hypothetical protein
MQTYLVMEAINRLTAARGEKKGDYYLASFSCKDVLDQMGAEITQGHLRHVAYIVTKGYPGSSVDGGSKESGRMLNIKIRSK